MKRQRPFLRSLRGKLLAFSVALVVVPGVTFAVVAYFNARRALQDAVGRLLAEVAHDTAAEVSELIQREDRNLQTWARVDLMRELLIDDLDKNVARFLTSVRSSADGYVALLCTNLRGDVVAASYPAMVGTSEADRPWFRTAVGGAAALSGPVLSPPYGLVLELGVPVYHPEKPGVIIGALLGRYDWTRSSQLAMRIQHNLSPLQLGADVFVLDDAGVVIAQAGGAGFDDLLGASLRDKGWEAAAASLPVDGPGFLHDTQAGVLAGYARVLPGPPWRAMVAQRWSDALLPVERMRTQLQVLLAAVLLAGIVLALLLADRMSRPLRALRAATRELARSGTVRQPVAVSSRDEIGDLAESFNAMARDLVHAQNSLITAAKFSFVGEVAAGIAHEVRTPLGVLRSSAQILERRLPQETAENLELIHMIVDEVDRLDRVVTGLLQLARPRVPQFEPADLAEVLRRALDFIEHQTRTRNIVVRRDLDSPVPRIWCDPEQIYQVALNLIVNALQMLTDGGEIGVRIMAAGHDRVAFEVSDSGPGIPAELQEQIFAPFFTMREGGTGLGLALVQHAVQAHKGTVAVRSQMGHGSTFRVELPAAQET